jgi:hypothetical protein
MSINDEEWYYGEDSQRWIPKGDAPRYMQGDGFDEEHNPFKIVDDFDVSLIGQKIEPCRCDVRKFTQVVKALFDALTERPQMFPVYDHQFDSFAQVGGYAGGPWHKFVDIAGSRVETRDEHGYIRLGSNCGVAGHSCKIIKIADDEFIIDGLSENGHSDKPANSSMQQQPREESHQTLDDRVDEFENLSTFEDEETDEEAQMYDDRTFGDLDESTPRIEDDSLALTPDMWRSSAYSDERILEYIAALLEPRDIAYISRFMPPDEIPEWISEFGLESLEALQMLNIALGGLHNEGGLQHEVGENADMYDTAVIRMTRDIRAVVKKHFVRFKKEVAHLEQKNRSDRENARYR